MTEKFQNKYRIPSARLQNWDYGTNGPYYITICTHNREHNFGKITNNVMEPNEIGKLAEKYWIEITNHFPFIHLGEFVIMPNHLHGILIINKLFDPTNENVGGNGNVSVETRLIASLPKIGGITAKNNPMIYDNISRIIRWYKGCCSFEMRKIHADFKWQTRFHDHIIRNENEFKHIQTYIANNPIN